MRVRGRAPQECMADERLDGVYPCRNFENRRSKGGKCLCRNDLNPPGHLIPYRSQVINGVEDRRLEKRSFNKSV